MDLYGITAVFQSVFSSEDFCRELAGFADGDETSVQAKCERSTEDEAACFDRCYLVDPDIGKR